MSEQDSKNFHSVQIITIDEIHAGQRLDNYLVSKLKRVPKSHLYRLMRKGEIRVNKKRIKPDYRLQADDKLRLPPIRYQEPSEALAPKSLQQEVRAAIFYEDDYLIAINKPSGLAVHSGSGIKFGVIEVLRQARDDVKYIELIHRLDRETSGVLLIAKQRKTLLAMQALLKDKQLKKYYYALVVGRWPRRVNLIEKPLNVDQYVSGERLVMVHAQGKPAKTTVQVVQYLPDETLLEMCPVTGRTHQLRVHAQAQGHPMLGDDKYGDSYANRQAKTAGLNRLFLHAHKIRFTHPNTGERIVLEAPMPKQLANYLEAREND